MAKISNEELRETRKQMFAQMELQLQEIHPKEERILPKLMKMVEEKKKGIVCPYRKPLGR